jgi:hypothetical protein
LDTQHAFSVRHGIREDRETAGRLEWVISDCTVSGQNIDPETQIRSQPLGLLPAVMRALESVDCPEVEPLCT